MRLIIILTLLVGLLTSACVSTKANNPYLVLLDKPEFQSGVSVTEVVQGLKEAKEILPSVPAISNRIQCKQLYIEIADRPKLLLNKQKIFADSIYMNISSKFNIEKSAASEFAKATEKASQTITESAMSQKESVERSKSSSATVKTPSLPQ
ncbi:hypothetical protein QI155_03305 [Thermodesulfovibrio sp. 1176]|uniref:hypothetical protein n=1 Tax=Thermodesulfovibrio sp. 1176 TaxID=3043424 RepID=UPI002482177E|nr:hypothetical protein [Thermodesulfovibrio sp. 1176]MDI1471551.1 hypothetical protein [Thermodesulfovibrio sp. 1176]